MKDLLSKEWNDDAVIVPSYENEQYESNGNKLKVTRWVQLFKVKKAS